MIRWGFSRESHEAHAKFTKALNKYTSQTAIPQMYITNRKIINHTFWLFSFPPFLSVWSICPCAQRRSWKLKRSKSAPMGSPLSHRKHCSWNTSSVVSPSILYDFMISNFIKLHVAHRSEANGKLKTQTSQLETRWAMLAQACVS